MYGVCTKGKIEYYTQPRNYLKWQIARPGRPLPGKVSLVRLVAADKGMLRTFGARSQDR